jgi:hypothetical protein
MLFAEAFGGGVTDMFPWLPPSRTVELIARAEPLRVRRM